MSIGVEGVSTVFRGNGIAYIPNFISWALHLLVFRYNLHGL
jgi:hypothetical protein